VSQFVKLRHGLAVDAEALRREGIVVYFPRLQCEHPAFKLAAEREAAIGVAPKYRHAHARIKRGQTQDQWAAEKRRWEAERAAAE
jgi:hypothetical protein